VVHRDVKPQNVLLSASGNAKVTDFGIARAADATTTSHSSLILGTAGYMSPEQVKGEPVGPRSDLYSLGIVLYEMLTGEMPYKANAPAAVAMKHIDEPPRSPREANPQVPEEIDALTLKLLAKDPADRYGSSAELAKDLRQFTDGQFPAFIIDTERVAADRAILPILRAPANPGGDSASGGSYAVYGRRFRKRPLALVASCVALLVLLGATAPWGPGKRFQEQQAQAQEVAGGVLNGLDETFEKDKLMANQQGEDYDAGGLPDGLPEDEGQESSTTDTGILKLAGLDFAPSMPSDTIMQNDAVVQNAAAEQDLRADVPVEPGVEVFNATASHEPEQVSVPEVSGGSAEEAAQVLSDAGHVPVGKVATQSSAEPAGTVIGTEPATETTINPGSAVTLIVSDGLANQQDSNGSEDAAPVKRGSILSMMAAGSGPANQEGSKGREDTAPVPPVPKETPKSTQPSKARKQDQKLPIPLMEKQRWAKDQRRPDQPEHLAR
jgi:serine/threonine-protein kinase